MGTQLTKPVVTQMDLAISGSQNSRCGLERDVGEGCVHKGSIEVEARMVRMNWVHVQNGL